MDLYKEYIDDITIVFRFHLVAVPQCIFFYDISYLTYPSFPLSTDIYITEKLKHRNI
jgi:hypothetical protein